MSDNKLLEWDDEETVPWIIGHACSVLDLCFKRDSDDIVETAKLYVFLSDYRDG